MKTLPEMGDFESLFSKNTPLIDVRAPTEFIKGSFPCTQNMPLINDQERSLIGHCYKNKGKEKALNLGHQLIKDAVKNKRVQTWLTFIKNNPNGALYCFRGGLRSQISQNWIYEHSGIVYPRITGGFKSMRQFLIAKTQQIIQKTDAIIIGGRTGCGKTLLLAKLSNAIDLERLANHRGSAFGSTTTAQPTQINFENNLAIELIKKQMKSVLVFEDEGKNIGSIHLPSIVHHKIANSKLILLHTTLEKRIQLSVKTYVVDMHQNFIKNKGMAGFKDFSNYWLFALKKIHKRLGLKRYQALKKELNLALIQHQKTGEVERYAVIIKYLLVNYYDPMYDYQIKKKKNFILFQGVADEVLHYLKKNYLKKNYLKKNYLKKI